MKGIILAGGYGTRMYPCSAAVTKQLFPVYDKPMVYYPLSLLLMAGITDILLITRSNALALFQALLGNGSKWGISIQYAIQDTPRGIAEAFILGETFIGSDSVCLALGDNILYGNNLPDMLLKAKHDNQAATLFTYQVQEPEHYGVVVYDKNNKPVAVEEKPQHPQSNHAVIGLYMYDAGVIEVAKLIKPSLRGELEITAINQFYLEHYQCDFVHLGRGIAWLDTGTPESLLEAANFIHIIEKRQGLKICCPAEIAWRQGFIDDKQLLELSDTYQSSSYGLYLKKLLEY